MVVKQSPTLREERTIRVFENWFLRHRFWAQKG
jgi:hypothetical protein